jgi:hypothetical protein
MFSTGHKNSNSRGASIFLFATLDGTISGWAPQVDLNNTIIAVTAPGAVYTGLAITSKASGNFLFAADNANNKVDMYDGNFKLVKSFTTPRFPQDLRRSTFVILVACSMLPLPVRRELRVVSLISSAKQESCSSIWLKERR